MKTLNDNSYIHENILKAQKDAKKACKEGKWKSHNSPLHETKKRNIYLLPWGSFHTVPHLLRSFLFFCSTRVQCNSSHGYKCQRCMWNNSIQRFHVFVGVIDMYTLKSKITLLWKPWGWNRLISTYFLKVTLSVVAALQY